MASWVNKRAGATFPLELRSGSHRAKHGQDMELDGSALVPKKGPFYAMGTSILMCSWTYCYKTTSKNKEQFAKEQFA
jgi:hypothetical protein